MTNYVLCSECLAYVDRDNAQMHETWHEALDTELRRLEEQLNDRINEVEAVLDRLNDDIDRVANAY